MTTHVFIVDENTFPVHLEYMFAGTGAGEKDVDFNDSPLSRMHHSSEDGLVAMMADCSRVRGGDLVIFYLLATSYREGRFFGVFRAVGDAFVDRNDGEQYLKGDLRKSLTFRVRIEPYEVYSEGVTEWEALDEIKNIQSPCQMLWSLIYRKLKGNRGNTMITIYEAERLIDLIRRKNRHIAMRSDSGYTYSDGKIGVGASNFYAGRMAGMNILPRLIGKFAAGKAHEAHLQMYIAQQLGRNDGLDRALGILPGQIEWIGNEVSCGVGMQRIDIMVSEVESETKRVVMPIELKAVPASSDNIRQIKRYIDWIEQYYIPNRTSVIQPVLLCKGAPHSQNVRECINAFDASAEGRYLPLRYVEYGVCGNELVFTQMEY